MSSYRDTAELEGAFQVGKKELLEVYPFRGMQPSYADNEEDPESLIYEGMIAADGNLIQKTTADMNVCALTSTCVRYGYVDLSLARSVSRDFYERKKVRAGVKKHDVLVNSTGDGTIGRVAVYDYDIPAVVDGHITILRYKNKVLGWYIAAFLLSQTGQFQLYRYINGSSGQVELYPQDIARVWVKPVDKRTLANIAINFRRAAKKHLDFQRQLRAALYNI